MKPYTITKAEASELYVEAVGYCPFLDDPTIQLDEVVDTLRGLADEYPYDNDPSVEALRAKLRAI